MSNMVFWETEVISAYTIIVDSAIKVLDFGGLYHMLEGVEMAANSILCSGLAVVGEVD